jgi:hypothetical protein
MARKFGVLATCAVAALIGFSAAGTGTAFADGSAQQETATDAAPADLGSTAPTSTAGGPVIATNADLGW